MSRLAEAPLQEFFAEAAAEHEEALRTQGAVERELALGTARVRLSFAGVELAQALLPAFGARVADCSSGAAEATVCVSAGSTGLLPWRLSDVGPRGLVRGSDGDGVVAIHELGSGALTLVDRGGGVGRGSGRIVHRVPGVQSIPWWERAAPLRPALFFALRGRQLVHAGAVGVADRGGALLAGAGGSGKSTVALACAKHGLAYAGDDYVLLDDGIAWNVYATAKVDSGESEEKLVLDVAAEYPGALVESLAVRAVVAPRIGDGPARLERISGADALLALAPSTLFQMPFDGGGAVMPLAGLVREVPCYRLFVGRDPAELARAIEEVLTA